MADRAIVIFNIVKRDVTIDLDVPLDISAIELVMALNQTYDLGINTSDVSNCYLKAEAPITLLKGNKTLKEFGVRHGTIINFDE